MFSGFEIAGEYVTRLARWGSREFSEARERRPIEVAGWSHLIETVVRNPRECQFSWWAPSRDLYRCRKWVAGRIASLVGLPQHEGLRGKRWRAFCRIMRQLYAGCALSLGWVIVQTERVHVRRRLEPLAFSIAPAKRWPPRWRPSARTRAARCIHPLPDVCAPVHLLEFDHPYHERLLEDPEGNPTRLVRVELERRFEARQVAHYFDAAGPWERQQWWALLDASDEATYSRQREQMRAGVIPAGLRHYHIPRNLNLAPIVSFVRMAQDGLQQRVAVELCPDCGRTVSVRSVDCVPLAFSFGMDLVEAQLCWEAWGSYLT